MRFKVTIDDIYVNDSGSALQPVYGYRYDDKGVKTLQIVDYKDFNLEIQTFASMCDIENVIARASLGDTTALNVRSGFYGDVTGMPRTMAEMYQKYNDSQNIFEKLPAQLKEKFNNSFEQFWSEYGSEKFEDKFDEFIADNSAVDKIKYRGQYYDLDQFSQVLGFNPKDVKEGVEDNE